LEGAAVTEHDDPWLSGLLLGLWVGMLFGGALVTFILR
jgi:hypothetical protein